MWYGMVNVDLYSTIVTKVSDVSHVLILGEKVCLQRCSKLIITKRWVTEIVRQRVPGHRADNRECPTTELAATMSWNDELVE